MSVKRVITSVLVALGLLLPATPAAAAQPTEVWARLGDCESGEWDRYGRPIPGSARWDDRRGYHEGGLHFAPSTWDAYRDPRMPGHAGYAHVWDQVWVAERVLAAQGWGAWPVCSRKLGYR
jgi:resuscitation-promoting factor RpfA